MAPRQGEDAAKKAYEEALKSDKVSGNVRELLIRQQGHIQQAHDRVKAMRMRRRRSLSGYA